MDNVVVMVHLGCHFSPFDGLRDDGGHCDLCVAATCPSSGECSE